MFALDDLREELDLKFFGSIYVDLWCGETVGTCDAFKGFQWLP